MLISENYNREDIISQLTKVSKIFKICQKNRKVMDSYMKRNTADWHYDRLRESFKTKNLQN